MHDDSAHVHATWYYERSGQKVGPLSFAQIASLTAKGGLTAATLVWRTGLEHWVALGATELAEVLAPPASIYVAQPTVAAAPVQKPKPAPEVAPNERATPMPTPLPVGVAGWSWGALLLSWIWAIRFRVWWGLLALIPVLGWGAAVWLGVKGRELAWRRGQWESVTAFNQVQRRWSLAGGMGAALATVVLAAVLVHENPDMLADLTGSGSKGGTFVKGEDAFNDMGKVLGLPDEPPSPVASMPGVAAAPSPADLLAAPAPISGGGVQRVEIQGSSFQGQGGTLQVVGDDQQGRTLVLNGQPVPRVSEDEMRLVAAYRYPDRDTVLVTTACSSTGCDWTWFLFVTVWATGQVDVLADDQLSIPAKNAAPDIAIQPDGSLRISFQTDKGLQQWLYANGNLGK